MMAGRLWRQVSPGGVRWAVGVLVTVMVAIGLVLMFLLTVATKNRQLYEQHYQWLFGINVLVAMCLLGVLGWIGWRLAIRLHRKRFGSRLLVKLAAIFAVVGLVPGLLIYVVSYQFVSRSIESWFDVQVEGALRAGVELAQSTLDGQVRDVVDRARNASAALPRVSGAQAGLALERVRDQVGATEALLWSHSGQLLAGAGEASLTLNPQRPSPTQLRLAREQRAWTSIEGLDELVSQMASPAQLREVRVHALVLVSNPSVDLLTEPRYLQIVVPMSPLLVANALAVQEANREYQERALARGGLRRMYIGTLTLSLFLAVFASVLLAVLLGNQLARPLLVLADGVREVAEGNLRPKAIRQGRDELDGLTRSFALMTAQLADARQTVERSIQAVEASRTHLQTMLDNLTAGVVVLDTEGVVRSVNPSASRILRAALAPGQSLADVEGLKDFALAVQQQFDAFLEHGEPQHNDHWEHAFDLQPSVAGVDRHATNLVARGALLPDAARLLVFDDITEIVSAQRVQAWGEVARRLAHEIKNPLTPIQLSAERLEMKLSGKLPPTEQGLLERSVRTIVEQVAAMQRLVNEFRDYARLPTAELQPLQLNDLVSDLLHLYEAEHAGVPVMADLDPECPLVMGDAQQLRQVIHNLLQNAQDATEQAQSAAATDEEKARARRVVIRTHWSQRTGRVRLIVRDCGLGFPEMILQRAFEPYVTTKPRGTGLGLAVVKKIAEEHGAQIELVNRMEDGVVMGAQVSLSFAPRVHQSA